MENLKLLYERTYEEKSTLLKDDFVKEKSEWRDMNLFNEYRNQVIESYNAGYPEDARKILFEAENLYRKRKSITDLAAAVIMLIESQEESYQINRVKLVAQIRAHMDFITYLDKYTAELNKVPETPSKSIILNLPKLTRTKDDNLTGLNQVQTAIFFKYMREAKVVLGENYLVNRDLSSVLSLITGYSAEQIRKRMSTNNKDYKKEDLREINKILDTISCLIKRDLTK